MKKNTKKNKARRGLLIGICIFLSVVLVVGIAGIIYAESLFGLLGNVGNQGELSQDEIDAFLQGEKDDLGGDEVDPDSLQWNDAPTLDGGKNIINILLIGQDRRPNEGRARSDAMILCTLNKTEKTLTMTSFMRDMYVKIPGYQANRINASYFLGGAQLLNETLTTNFGVQIDGNIEVDFYGCMECIDVIGGVEVELSEAEASYLNRKGNWEVSNDAPWSLKAGVNNLTGSQAVAYSRIRYIGNGDFERTERQRNVLNAIFNKCKNLSIPEMHKLLSKLLPNMGTDMTNAELISHATTVLTMASELTIVNQRIPADGTYSNSRVNGMSVLLPDLEKNRELLANVIKPTK